LETYLKDGSQPSTVQKAMLKECLWMGKTIEVADGARDDSNPDLRPRTGELAAATT